MSEEQDIRQHLCPSSFFAVALTSYAPSQQVEHGYGDARRRWRRTTSGCSAREPRARGDDASKTVARENATHTTARDRLASRRSTWERLRCFCRSRPSQRAL